MILMMTTIRLSCCRTVRKSEGWWSLAEPQEGRQWRCVPLFPKKPKMPNIHPNTPLSH